MQWHFGSRSLGTGWQERRLIRLVPMLIAAGFILIAALAGLAGYGWAVAVGERNAAEQQRDEANGLRLATLATQAFAGGDDATAMLLAIEALPDTSSGVRRPYVP